MTCLLIFSLVGILADPLIELERLRRALEAVSEDLDAIERRPHFSLRLAAQDLTGQRSSGIEGFIDHFAFALRRGKLT
jgi:hypothetical protein